MTKGPATTSVVIATVLASVCAPFAAVATPTAGADPLDGPRTAVERARADSTCPPLNYKVDLEDLAQRYARDRKSSPGDNPGPGQVVGYYGSGDPQSKAIDGMMAGGAAGAIRDCRYTDYGVGFVRYEDMELDFVSVVLGPGAQPAPAAKPAPPAAQPKTATVVGGNADIYNIAHNADPDPATGVRGTKLGTLQVGQQVTLAAGGPCTPGSWCKIVMPDDPARFGFVLGHLQL